MELTIYDVLFIVICGLIGGFINCVLFQQGITFPYSEIGPNNERIYKLGSFGPIILGVAASLLAWGFGVGQMKNLQNELALLVLSGIGGGSFITNLLQKHQIIVEANKLKTAIDVAKKSINQINEAKKSINQINEARQVLLKKKSKPPINPDSIRN